MPVSVYLSQILLSTSHGIVGQRDAHLWFLKYFQKPANQSAGASNTLCPKGESLHCLGLCFQPCPHSLPLLAIALLVVLLPEGILLSTPSQSLCLSPGGAPREICFCVYNPLVGSASKVLWSWCLHNKLHLQLIACDVCLMSSLGRSSQELLLIALWSGRSPGEGNGNPLQYSCLEHPMDRGA